MLMSRNNNKIVVVSHDPDWAVRFQELKAVYEEHVGKHLLSVEHVGSTSVPGLAAKPKIDIDIIIEDDNKVLQSIIQGLEKLGYEYAGDRGVPGREAFLRSNNQIPLDGSGRDWMLHNLYVCKEGNIGLQNHLNLRNYLRANPDAAAEYGALKQELALKFPYDIDAYIDGKTDFIINILKKSGMDIQAVNAIEQQNKLE